jgi:hypothetical protein
VKEGLSVRDLRSVSDARGLRVDLWGEEPGSWTAEARDLFPGEIVCWINPVEEERIYCLRGMVKLVVCEKSGEREPLEVYLGEYKPREVRVAGNLLYGYKAVGHENALVIRMWRGKEGALLSPEEASVPYRWEIVMR